MDETVIEAVVTGRVQGVSFRAWTQDEARARGLRGWVRNEADGSVRACIAGPQDVVEGMVAALHDGPPAARVDGVATAPAAPPAGRDFAITG